MNTIEFIVKNPNHYNLVEIAGYCYLEEIDEEHPLHFYNQQGFEYGTRVPSNPYPENDFLHMEYEELAIEFQSDDMFLQYLHDSADDCHKVINRENYIIIINPCRDFEDTLCYEIVGSHKDRTDIEGAIQTIIENDARFKRVNHNTIECEFGTGLTWNVNFGDREITDAFCNSMKSFMRGGVE